jgi:hypothetical protein
MGGEVMKRLLFAITIVGAATILGGCPIYPDAGNYIVCSSSQCFDCPDPSLSGACVPWLCSASADCGDGYSCSAQGFCGPGSGSDAGTGNCACPAGTICRLSNGALQCVTPDEAGGGGTTGADASGGAVADVAQDVAIDVLLDAMVDVATGSPPDAAADRPDAASASATCNADATCGGGRRCIDGQCTPRSQLCSDATQCVVAGEACVNGVCVPHCSQTVLCPGGYDCDYSRGVCLNGLSGCASTGQCRPGAVCVESRCVAPCAPADAGPGCPAGLVCVNGGCIPDERAQFSCKNEGESGVLATTCDPASICLHGDCYPACVADGGGCTSPGTACKYVTIAKGTYAVCAGPSSLGSDCDPAVGKDCSAGAMCIDGYCK